MRNSAWWRGPALARALVVVVLLLVGAGEASAGRVADRQAGVAPQGATVSPTVSSSIHNASHVAVTEVIVGATVHDFVTVSGSSGVPTGNVTFDWFLNGTCAGAAAVNSGSIGPLNGSGNYDATAFAFTLNSVGQRAFRAHYLGNGTYSAADGPCEALAIVGKLSSTVTSVIHNATHGTVTAVLTGSTVHDSVAVSTNSGGSTPTGNFNIDYFVNGTCAGAAAVNSGSIGPLDGSGSADATGFSFTLNSAGQRSFKAHYEGDATHLAADGSCEPLTIASPRPDGRIRKGSDPFVGNNIYNTDASDQSVTAARKRGDSVKFTLSIQNDALAKDRLTVQCAGSVTGYTIKYLRGATDITAAVVAGTYLTKSLAPGATVSLTAKVKVTSSATVGSNVARLVSIRSAAQPSILDVVKFTVNRQ